MKRVLFCAFLLAAPSALRAQSFCGPVTADTLVAPTVLGNGMPGSVTTAQIQTALTAGGHILFNVGTSPTTIVLTATLTINRAVVLDGAGVVTLSGGGARRIIQISPQPATPYQITLQNISFTGGSAPTGRGGAIFNQSGGFVRNVSLKLVNCAFSNNAAMAVGQDDGGGALYATLLNRVEIGNCTFTNNTGSNGGAVYSLVSTQVTVVDSLFTGNQATGNGGNPGNGGNAGALGVDGDNRLVDICRTRFVSNTSNAYGAGFFSVMYDNNSRTRFEDVTFDSNQQLSGSQFAAGVYVQGGPFAFERTSFVNNNANAFTGLFVGPGASGTIRNGTFVGNVARVGLGGAMAIDSSAAVSIVNTTIANNVATAAFAGGISIGSPNQLRLTNVILANNTGGNRFVNWNIQNAAAQDGGGNMEWPSSRPMGGGPETPATPTTVFQDPLLAGAAAANGGQVPTIALTALSPAINTGVSTAEVPATDARGQVRAGAPDRGSFEFVLPQISIGDVSVPEGGSGTSLATFTVTLTPASTQTVTVQYATADNTALAGSDYVATSGTVTFTPGQTSRPIPVTVNGDIVVEANETFFVNLTTPTGATIADGQGVGTIQNDDPNADVSITKTDGVATAAPGQMLTYTITATNAGPNDAPGTMVADPLPSGLTGATWTCAGVAGGICGSPSGSGSIAQTADLPVGGSVVYTLLATVVPVPLTVRNTATVTAPAGFGEPNPANNSATDDDLLVCGTPQGVVVPDGRLIADSLATGATAWFVASLHNGSSYSAEFTNRSGAAGAPTLTVFRGDDGCSPTSTAGARDTTTIDPTPGASGRQSFTASGTDPRYRLRLVNGTGSPLSYTLQVAETSLFSPAWSTNGPFDTFYSFQNTTGATVTGTLTLRDATGATVSSSGVTILAGRTTSANTAGLSVTRNRTGTAQFSHDGPPGAVVVESAIANFALSNPYVQPVKFLAPREQR